MSGIPQLSPADARALLAERGDGAVLLDVREPWEYDLVHLDGALHIPMGDVQDKLEELNSDRMYVVMCHHGRRSQQVALYLAAHGFRQVSNLAGGIEAWAEALDPNLPRY
ncbi:MAG TPA: rhodanese-like domain-containing protein [Gammaproteobacteria bacterium]|nr:rhodanese-like domain-containing protein [Gammaproteobacteria bacterium]